MRLVKLEVAERAPDLNAAAIRAEVKAIRRDAVADATYESEMTVYFWRGRELVDALEFHVYRHGEPEFGLDDFREWLRSALGDVVNRMQRPQ